MTSQIINFITQNTGLDRNKVNNEIDKIISCFSDKKVDFNKIDSLLNNRTNDDFNLLKDEALKGNKINTNRLLADTVFEIEDNTTVYKDSNVKVDCLKVPHGEADPSYAYRFEIENKRIVFSGDTSKSEALINFSSHADILVHEVLNLEGVDAIIKNTYPGNEAFRKHIVDGHTSMAEVGQVANEANVKTLVLNHFVPTGSPILDKEEIWLAGVGEHFKGSIIVGTDLKKISF